MTAPVIPRSSFVARFARMLAAIVVVPIAAALVAVTTGFTAAPAGDRATIARYYGDTDLDTDGGDTSTGHADLVDSPYARAMGRIVDRELPYVRHACTRANAAIVFDVDDTLLNTYDMYVGVMHYRLDRTLKAAWVRHEKFAAVPAMVRFATVARSSGCRLIVLSGRPASQNSATLANLKKVGYPAIANTYGNASGLSSQEFKTATRAHLARAGIQIVANIGDQRSDLSGGHAARDIRVPNRMYSIP